MGLQKLHIIKTWVPIKRKEEQGKGLVDAKVGSGSVTEKWRKMKEALIVRSLQNLAA